MKAKLLKKIRKRYTITYYANGVFLYDDFFEGPITVLEDKQSSYRAVASCKQKQEAYEDTYAKLLEWIQKDYGTFKNRRKNIISEQLWYKNK